MLFFDSYYFIFVVPAMLLAAWAQMKVSTTFNKYSNVATRSGMTGYEAARRILDANGLRHIRIERVAGKLSDHYDPKAEVIRLSDAVYSSPSVAAIGVAAHEAGHAVQYSENYAPIKVRAAIIPITQIGSNLAVPIILLGTFIAPFLVDLGLIMFASVAVFQLVTLPVEFNASSRAVKALDMSGTVADSELRGVKKVLSAAALTYVAALILAVANLLRMIALFGNRRD